MIEDKNVLITGGAGFIGSHLIEQLAPTNRVTVLDSLARNALAERLGDDHGIDVVVGDVLDMEVVERAVADKDIIVHCAAIAGIDTVIKRPVHTLRVNILGSWNVLEAAARAGKAERVVCFSTSEVFGRHAPDAVETGDAKVGPPGEARYTYAVGKLTEEHLALAYHSEQGVPVVVLRPFNVYGPGQIGEGAVRNFTLGALAGEDLVIRGLGTHTRAWTYVSDMVQGVVSALSAPGAVGEDFNIGNPAATISVTDLANLIVRLSGSNSKVVHAAGDDADVVTRFPHIGKAREVLDFEPLVDLETGLARTIEYYRSQIR